MILANIGYPKEAWIVPKNLTTSIVRGSVDRIMHKFFKEEYVFTLIKAYEKPFKFKSDVLTAYQLASNYEADLFLGNECLLSPLGYTWEKNEKLIRNNLGGFFKNYRLLANKDFNNVEEIIYKK